MALCIWSGSNVGAAIFDLFFLLLLLLVMLRPDWSVRVLVMTKDVLCLLLTTARVLTELDQI